MEFDKSRVYTAVNADELKVGSKCIFADTVKALRKKVQADDYAQYVQPFIRLHDNGYDVQFLADCYTYAYAYLIEPPAEPKYKPFESVDKAMEAIRKHGGWIKSKTTQGYFLIGALKSKKFTIIGHEYWEPFSFLLEHYVFADDGSPCGELVVE
nr:MAG TPA: hypothetical protein [Caudoviricetes sp.]